jgi:hypothetical protein
VEIDPTRMCELLVGLPDVEVLGIDSPEPGHLVVVVAAREDRPSCARCGTAAWVKDYREVDLVELPAFDQTVTLRVIRTRWRCPRLRCQIAWWPPPAVRRDPRSLEVFASPRSADVSDDPVGHTRDDTPRHGIVGGALRVVQAIELDDVDPGRIQCGAGAPHSRPLTAVGATEVDEFRTVHRAEFGYPVEVPEPPPEALRSGVSARVSLLSAQRCFGGRIQQSKAARDHGGGAWSGPRDRCGHRSALGVAPHDEAVDSVVVEHVQDLRR